MSRLMHVHRDSKLGAQLRLALCVQGRKTMELCVASGLDGKPVDVVRYAAALCPQRPIYLSFPPSRPCTHWRPAAAAAMYRLVIEYVTSLSLQKFLLQAGASAIG